MRMDAHQYTREFLLKSHYCQNLPERKWSVFSKYTLILANPKPQLRHLVNQLISWSTGNYFKMNNLFFAASQIYHVKEKRQNRIKYICLWILLQLYPFFNIICRHKPGWSIIKKLSVLAQLQDPQSKWYNVTGSEYTTADHNNISGASGVDRLLPHPTGTCH